MIFSSSWMILWPLALVSLFSASGIFDLGIHPNFASDLICCIRTAPEHQASSYLIPFSKFSFQAPRPTLWSLHLHHSGLGWINYHALSSSQSLPDRSHWRAYSNRRQSPQGRGQHTKRPSSSVQQADRPLKRTWAAHWGLSVPHLLQAWFVNWDCRYCSSDSDSWSPTLQMLSAPQLCTFLASSRHYFTLTSFYRQICA